MERAWVPGIPSLLFGDHPPPGLAKSRPPDRGARKRSQTRPMWSAAGIPDPSASPTRPGSARRGNGARGREAKGVSSLRDGRGSRSPLREACVPRKQLQAPPGPFLTVSCACAVRVEWQEAGCGGPEVQPWVRERRAGEPGPTLLFASDALPQLQRRVRAGFRTLGLPPLTCGVSSPLQLPAWRMHRSYRSYDPGPHYGT